MNALEQVMLWPMEYEGIRIEKGYARQNMNLLE